SLRRLKLERIDLWQLHRIDPQVPADEQFGLLGDLIGEGKVRHVGLSEVTVDEVEAARRVVPIASVQNRYNLAERTAEPLLEYCEQEQIGFIPWFPLVAGKLAEPGGALAQAATRHGVTPGQVALAWLLARSPVMLPIPGTSRVAHLDENVAAASLQLTAEEVARVGGEATDGGSVAA
ncbi:MAG TPA: aldo/keto reductase, partial [Gemmatirosa sp.]